MLRVLWKIKIIHSFIVSHEEFGSKDVVVEVDIVDLKVRSSLLLRTCSMYDRKSGTNLSTAWLLAVNAYNVMHVD